MGIARLIKGVNGGGVIFYARDRISVCWKRSTIPRHVYQPRSHELRALHPEQQFMERISASASTNFPNRMAGLEFDHGKEKVEIMEIVG